MEPLFSALVAAVAFGQIFPWPVYLSLLPVIAGVLAACATDVTFGWFAFLTAMASNLAFALRANYSKRSMAVLRKEADSSAMTPANIYGLVTIRAFLLSLPLALLTDLPRLPTLLNTPLKTPPRTFLTHLLLSGLFHYLNNEVMYLALDSVHPITLAVGNTAKRIFIILASLLVFRNPISFTGALGSSVGISGVLLYSLTKQYYDTRQESGERRAQAVA